MQRVIGFREVTGGQIVKGLAGHCEDSGHVNLTLSEDGLKDYKQKSTVV